MTGHFMEISLNFLSFLNRGLSLTMLFFMLPARNETAGMINKNQ